MKVSDDGRVKTREINITQALVYSFLPKNLVNIFLLPFVGAIILVFGPGKQNDATGVICVIVYIATLLGYGWSILHILRIDGYEGRAPDWTIEKTFRSLWDGLKLLIVLSLMLGPVILTTYILTDERAKQFWFPCELTASQIQSLTCASGCTRG